MPYRDEILLAPNRTKQQREEQQPDQIEETERRWRPFPPTPPLSSPVGHGRWNGKDGVAGASVHA